MRKKISAKKPTTPAMMTAITISCTSPLRMWVSSCPSTASSSSSLRAFSNPVVTVTEYWLLVEAAREGVQRVGLHHLQLRHRDAARDAEIFEQIVKPRLFLAGHLVAAGHRIDDRLVEVVGDDDPDRRRDRSPRATPPEIAPGRAQVVVERSVLVQEHLQEDRAGEHDHVDQEEQPDQQQDRTRLVRCDVGVETVGGHGA